MDHPHFGWFLYCLCQYLLISLLVRRAKEGATDESSSIQRIHPYIVISLLVSLVDVGGFAPVIGIVENGFFLDSRICFFDAGVHRL